MEATVAPHVHKYKRVILSERTGAVVFKCQIPGCKRFLARNLVIGEKSICWKCDGELVLTTENTSLAKPTHPECRGKRDAVAPIETDEAEEFMKRLGL